jgi:nucleoside-diphosphate-sugar epimerase
MERMRVLFVGATGIVGRQVVPELREKYDLTLAALGGGGVDGMEVCEVDITDLKSVESMLKAGALDGKPFDAIINCAVADHSDDGRRSGEALHEYSENCINVNARGACNVFEAAARAEVPLVVYVSSMTAVLGPPIPERIDATTHDQPNNIYAASKVFGEHIGRYYAHRPKIDGRSVRVICLRLGQPYKSYCFWDDLWPQSADARRLAVDYRDIAQSIDCALRADVNYGVYSIVSECDATMVDPELYHELGYRPGWRFSADGLFPVDNSELTVSELPVEAASFS